MLSRFLGSVIAKSSRVCLHKLETMRMKFGTLLSPTLLLGPVLLSHSLPPVHLSFGSGVLVQHLQTEDFEFVWVAFLIFRDSGTARNMAELAASFSYVGEGL